MSPLTFAALTGFVLLADPPDPSLTPLTPARPLPDPLLGLTSSHVHKNPSK